MQFDQLKRREFISLVGGAMTSLAWPFSAPAQEPGRTSCQRSTLREPSFLLAVWPVMGLMLLTRREASRPAPDQVQIGHHPENRQSTRPRHSAHGACRCRRGDRLKVVPRCCRSVRYRHLPGRAVRWFDARPLRPARRYCAKDMEDRAERHYTEQCQQA
jgi:hypothetical protein